MKGACICVMLMVVWLSYGYASNIDYAVTDFSPASATSEGDGVIIVNYYDPEGTLQFNINLYVEKKGFGKLNMPTDYVPIKIKKLSGEDITSWFSASPSSVKFEDFGYDPDPNDPSDPDYTGIPGGWYTTVIIQASIPEEGLQINQGEFIAIKIEADTSGIPFLGNGHGVVVRLHKTTSQQQTETFTETFSTTTYMDEENTTADWDTSTGFLKLKKVVDNNCLENVNISQLAQVNLHGIFPTRTKVYGNLLIKMDIDNGFEIYDITNPSQPLFLSHIPDASSNYLICWFNDFAVKDNYLYIACHGYDTLNWKVISILIFDISNPSLPVFFDTISGSYFTMSINISGNFAYTVSLGGTLRVYDISNPSQISHVKTFYTGTGISLIARLLGNQLFIGGFYKFTAVDVSAPIEPELLGYIYTWAPGWEIEFSKTGDYAYVAGLWDGMVVIKIDDPQNMEVVYSYTSGDLSCFDVSLICNTYLFTVFSHSNFIMDPLIVLNIQDPENPVYLTQFQPSIEGYEGLSFAVSGTYGYMCGFTPPPLSGAMVVLKLGEPGGYYITPAQAQSTKINENSEGKITKAKLTCVQNLSEFGYVFYQLSNDGGLTWHDAPVGEEVIFTTDGNDLRWRAFLSTENTAYTPAVDEITIEYTINSTTTASSSFSAPAPASRVSVPAPSFQGFKSPGRGKKGGPGKGKKGGFGKGKKGGPF